MLGNYYYYFSTSLSLSSLLRVFDIALELFGVQFGTLIARSSSSVTEETYKEKRRGGEGQNLKFVSPTHFGKLWC